ncbi:MULTISPECIES: SH3 domain-containing protein [unclassified Streptomyces]|uniref:SH3 domain-containing protein n=1 Tax=unclassified Streptomyces TaxID=2593676 RepID=UPI0022551925|nr:SH3 domain-containing protein [Streptomyces sp. NBC_01264]MCX4783934.1 SH3 domain-containing protein [Streptomyces sp. NBC_01264]
MQSKLISRAGVTVATIAMGAAASLAAAPTAFAASTGAPTQAPTVLAAANTCPTWTVTGNGVNFRSGAGTKYRAIGQLYRNDYGTKIASSGSWIKLKLDKKSKSGLKAGTTGWVSKSYLDQCVYMNLD